MSTPAARPCPQCNAPLAFVSESPHDGTSCIIIILGLVLTPILIGIPILIYGFKISGQKKESWHCSGCGRQFPAVAFAAPERQYKCKSCGGPTTAARVRCLRCS